MCKAIHDDNSFFSRKRLLLNGVLEEAEALGETSVTKHGRITYVPQAPFILNQTVRNNVLFGLPFDRERYEKVLDAYCLRPDLEQLGEAGNLTEIAKTRCHLEWFP
jgi:ATP-binding cassette subfamily C (CFTR/MRP) protein 1